jgi:hypothetical protein
LLDEREALDKPSLTPRDNDAEDKDTHEDKRTHGGRLAPEEPKHPGGRCRENCSDAQ